jgi:hypothetical protein
MLARSLYLTYHSPNQRTTQGWEEGKGPKGPFSLLLKILAHIVGQTVEA